MAVSLGRIADSLGATVAPHDRTIVVEDVTHDSRAVRPGWLFVAVRGATHDGHDHLDAAVAAGAVAVLVEEPVRPGVPRIVVPDTRAAMAPAARQVHGAPDVDLSIVGVTGTNGKTTVVHMCEAVWRSIGRPHGLVGTLGARFEGTPVPLARTTPESTDLQRLLGTMRDSGVESVAMEVSSHALELHRADAIRFLAVGFTNLSQDHLDFHATMERYLDAKRKLFEIHRASQAVVNTDDPAGRSIAATTPLPVVSVGFDEGVDWRATGVSLSPTGTRFELRGPGGSAVVDLPLAGRFNVENALVASGLLACDGVSIAEIAEGLAAIDPIPGRMEVVGHGGPFTVIVDYAHTPDAIAEVLAASRAMASGRIISVVGAGGDRDAAKRTSMGAAAASESDVTIVTTDNPRSEDPVEIARRVQEGALAAGRADVRMVLERDEAISVAIAEANPSDVVLILGKGHEQGQEIGGVMHPFDDREAARRALAAAGWGEA